MTRVSWRDPRLSARVTRRWPLAYAEGADAGLDRPRHLRSGSALVRLDHLLVIVQDDVNFLGLLDLRTEDVSAITLPLGPGGRRQFDRLRGNKMDKLDLEAAIRFGARGLLAFGSGSAPGRDVIVRATGIGGVTPEIALIRASALYEGLRAAEEFSGSELNVEGALLLGDHLRLFNRGNGAPRAGNEPVNATCELDWIALQRYLADPSQPPPAPRAVERWSLGEIDGFKLTFTDAAVGPWGVQYLAAAEDCPDAVEDGPVAGMALGLLGADGGRWCPLLGEDGEIVRDKAEGLALDPADPRRGHVVFDLDDPERPTEVAEIALLGPWDKATTQVDT